MGTISRRKLVVEPAVARATATRLRDPRGGCDPGDPSHCDAGSYRVETGYNFDAPDPGRWTAVAVVVARGSGRVADDGAHVAHAIDPRTGSAVTSIAVARNPVALAASGRWLWVGHATGVVVRVDMEKRRAGPRLAAGQSITGIAARGNRVWACDLPNNALVEIDAKKAKVVRSIDVSRGPVRATQLRDLVGHEQGEHR